MKILFVSLTVLIGLTAQANETEMFQHLHFGDVLKINEPFGNASSFATVFTLAGDFEVQYDFGHNQWPLYCAITHNNSMINPAEYGLIERGYGEPISDPYDYGNYGGKFGDLILHCYNNGAPLPLVLVNKLLGKKAEIQALLPATKVKPSQPKTPSPSDLAWSCSVRCCRHHSNPTTFFAYGSSAADTAYEAFSIAVGKCTETGYSVCDGQDT